MEDKFPKINILDCTIRDGSYLINYQFTTEDTYLIASSLCNAGLKRIEVGHGLGLGAQERGKGPAADEDVRYIEAGVAAVGNLAKIGTFFIPGIGTLDNIRQAADAGLSFIRVGTNIDEFAQGEAAISLAKQLGLEVWSNLMKSYVSTPGKFAETCRAVEDLGADVAVLVDSAGGMTPEQIKTYTQNALEKIKIPLGFHGHNNLDLVIANCLSFAMAGGSYVDASLRGMGRSAGNAATEIVTALLIREGFDIGPIDYRELMRLAENLIAPGMPRDTGLLPEEIAAGLACFHSSFQSLVDKASHETGVKSFETILELPKESRVNVSDIMALSAAQKAQKRHKIKIQAVGADDQWIQRTSCQTLKELGDTLRILSAKTGFPIVMTMARPRGQNAPSLRITPVRVGQKFCVGHIESASLKYDNMVWDYFIPDISNWMVDKKISVPDSLPEKTQVLNYDDDRLLITALDDFLRILCKDKTVYIPVSNDRLTKLATAWLDLSHPPPCDVGLALCISRAFGTEDVNHITPNGTIIMVQPETLTLKAIQAARKSDIDIWRLDLGDALLAEVTRVFNTCLRFKNHAGKREISGIPIVAGGMVGNPGDIAVNSISMPTIIFGKTDGQGGISALSQKDMLRRRRIIEWISQHGVSKG